MGILWAVSLPISQWWSLRASDRVLQVVTVQWTIRWYKLEILNSSWKGLKLQNLCCSNAAVMPWQTWSCNFVDPTEICIAHMQSHSQDSQFMSPLFSAQCSVAPSQWATCGNYSISLVTSSAYIEVREVTISPHPAVPQTDGETKQDDQYWPHRAGQSAHAQYWPPRAATVMSFISTGQNIRPSQQD